MGIKGGKTPFEIRAVRKKESRLVRRLSWIQLKGPDRKRNRLAGYDYSRDGLYFVTISVHDRKSRYKSSILTLSGSDRSADSTFWTRDSSFGSSLILFAIFALALLTAASETGPSL